MSESTLPPALLGEQQRLALMSALLDPMERAHLARLGVCSGWRCLELGCGNGSIAQALAEIVVPTGHVVASDIDLSYLEPCKGRVCRSAALIFWFHTCYQDPHY